MRIEQDNWTTRRLFDQRDHIDLNPTWQRGPAWKNPRQVLLIDSILRGMDIPKVYLRRLAADAAFGHDAVDGQQRLRAIWSFRSDEMELTYSEPLGPIDGHQIADKRFAQLHKSLRDRFDAFEVSIAEIVQSTPDEISTLFSRLQLGVSLNPAELRNALGGAMRHVVDAIALSHQFFENSRIRYTRYKRQDYAAHAFAMAAYRGRRAIKAPDLRALFTDVTSADRVLELSAEVGDALNVLAEVNEIAGHRIIQKWIFVDLAWLVIECHADGIVIDPIKLAAAYQRFEVRRREYTGRPEELLRPRRPNAALDRHLYSYINAFRTQGGQAASLRARATALRAFCNDIDGIS